MAVGSWRKTRRLSIVPLTRQDKKLTLDRHRGKPAKWSALHDNGKTVSTDWIYIDSSTPYAVSRWRGFPNKNEKYDITQMPMAQYCNLDKSGYKKTRPHCVCVAFTRRLCRVYAAQKWNRSILDLQAFWWLLFLFILFFYFFILSLACHFHIRRIASL
jgi:hypothetical protein